MEATIVRFCPIQNSFISAGIGVHGWGNGLLDLKDWAMRGQTQRKQESLLGEVTALAGLELSAVRYEVLWKLREAQWV